MRHLFLLLAPSLLFTACAPDSGDSGKSDDTEASDADGDGVVGDEDCDDTNASVFSGAPEVCDDLDNDCDGDTDEDATDASTWYADTDADTWGDQEATTIACDQPEGTSSSPGDCDDTNAAVYPQAPEDDCTDPVDYNCDGSSEFVDADLDTYAACVDCNDADATVNPAATEICNDIDDNCDTVTDTDATDKGTWYLDGDLDGYGTDESPVVECDAPSGYIAAGGDCNDADALYHPGADESDCTDPNDYNCDGSVMYADADADTVPACEDCDDSAAAVFPGATEICNEIDDNCDTVVDEDSAADATTWYADGDEDGYGDPAVSYAACLVPAGYTASWDDCDDTSAAVNPGATEMCNEIDDDCDTETDEDSAADAGSWYADADGDDFGDASMERIQCDQPDDYVSDATDCDDEDAAQYPGADELCNEDDDNCDGEVDEATAVDAPTWYADTDSDDFGDPSVSLVQCDQPEDHLADDQDCDDANPNVHPDADENCDGIDNNCADGIDEDSALDASTWYADSDGDSYGDPEATTLACEVPEGYLDDDQDCNDSDENEYPGAPEYCDGADDDCDGEIDEAEAVDAAVWYADTDGDDFGDVGATTLGCSQPEGYVGDATDCDDAEAAANPDETESCDDIDNDCDTEIDEAGAEGETTWYYDGDGDDFGNPDVSATACDAPADHVADGTDCDDSESVVNPGYDEVCEDGLDNNCNGDDDGCDLGDTISLADADNAWYGAATNDYLGGTYADSMVSIVGLGDVDGDLSPDLLVGAYGYDLNSSNANAGRAYLFSGPLTGSETLSDADATVTGQAGGDRIGTSLAGGGYDFDGDELDDVLIGSEGRNTTQTDGGAAYVLVGGPSGALSTSSASLTISGAAKEDFVGYGVTFLGDIDGDEMSEIAVGAQRYDGAATDAGAVAVYLGGSAGSKTFATDAYALISGAASGDYAGTTLAGGSDADGDGVPDLLLGAMKVSSSSGAAYLVSGASIASMTLSTSDAAVVTGGSSDNLGNAVALPGDLDDDGYDDLAVSAHKADGTSLTDAGKVYVFAGPLLTGAFSTADAVATITGTTAYDYVGRALSGAGDVNADGYVDLAVGATGVDESTSTTGNGAMFLAYGPLSGSMTTDDLGARFLGVAASDAVGASVAGPGDLNGDGWDDLLTGGAAVDNGSTTNTGGTYLIFGTGL